MAAWLDTAPARSSAQPVPPAEAPRRSRPRPQRAQRRVAGGVAWIGTLALLLTGIVALNVAVLQLNVRLDELSRERANLRAQNAALEAQLSSAAAPMRIEQMARRKGLVPAAPEQTEYLDLRARR
jgi:cell division protein FtsL